MNSIACRLLSLVMVFLVAGLSPMAQESSLSKFGLYLLPYPRQVAVSGNDFSAGGRISIVLGSGASAKDQFAANELRKFITDDLGGDAVIEKKPGSATIRLNRNKKLTGLGKEGYQISVKPEQIVVSAPTEAGLFYGVQTLQQLFQRSGNEWKVKGMEIRDWPDTEVRAAHYDTKHHQDTKEYVQSFIRELAGYKMNMLVWEWEDKFAYPSHPEIGAPGAFTMKEMQELTRYAQQYHVQIVPLVQGLGHVGFILKWPEFAHLREVPASNFEFCPLKDSSYTLLYDLWKDAMEATPGAKYIHIGSDETYELGKCPDCSKKEQEIGKSGLYHLFLGRSTRMLLPHNREVMTWEAPMGWAKGRLDIYHGGAAKNDSSKFPPVIPQKGMIMTESYNYETPDLAYAKKTKELGYPVYAYDPNPGIEQLFLPYFFTKTGKGKIETGALENSYNFLKETMGKGVFDGVIRTSWDDSGLPMQAWMLSFAITAAYSWNANGYDLNEFTNTFYKNRYGSQEKDIHTIYRILNESAYFYMESFERRVWAWGEIGKTHLPDLPRGDAIEFDPFWNIEYADRVEQAEIFLRKTDTALNIARENLKFKISNSYDIEVFETLLELSRHTALTYLDLSNLEKAVKAAHDQRFLDLNKAYEHLSKAEQIVASSLSRREKIFGELNDTWNKTRLEKGMSTPDKKYFFEQERTRHFANRVPDMTYLIYDEQLLGLEEYQADLQKYIKDFREHHKAAITN